MLAKRDRTTENMSLHEIAAVFGVSKQSVSRTLNNALEKLRKEFEQRGISKEEYKNLFQLSDEDDVIVDALHR